MGFGNVLKILRLSKGEITNVFRRSFRHCDVTYDV